MFRKSHKIAIFASILLFLGTAFGEGVFNFHRKLIYQCDFSSPNDLSDWVMEGPGVAKVKNGKLLIYPEFHGFIMDLWKKGKVFQEHKMDYYDELAPVMKKKYGKDVKKFYLEGKGLKGGHIVFWNKKPTPDNYMLEYDFKSLSPLCLHLVHFSTTGLNGESIFDEKLQKRHGVAAEYMHGDIKTYRISYFHPHRGTANMRKAPGRIFTATGPDVVSLKPDAVHHIKIIKWANKVHFIADNHIVFTYEDSNPLGGGFWGLRLLLTAKGEYDDFKVYQLFTKPFLK